MIASRFPDYFPYLSLKTRFEHKKLESCKLISILSGAPHVCQFYHETALKQLQYTGFQHSLANVGFWRKIDKIDSSRHLPGTRITTVLVLCSGRLYR